MNPNWNSPDYNQDEDAYTEQMQWSDWADQMMRASDGEAIGAELPH